jgi:hypothetical protein
VERLCFFTTGRFLLAWKYNVFFDRIRVICPLVISVMWVCFKDEAHPCICSSNVFSAPGLVSQSTELDDRYDAMVIGLRLTNGHGSDKLVAQSTTCFQLK